MIIIGCNCGKSAPQPVTDQTPNPNQAQTSEAWWQANTGEAPPAPPVPSAPMPQ